ncbi:hypothetical protein P12x_003042 [Tundrisphaera lichenicola]|uniref:hypothetical protein n=1 Tax=Tundrisphaera lichenicola TaxID=2029860 RepID=UPI003EBCB92A
MRRNRMPQYAPAPVEQRLNPSGNPSRPREIGIYLVGAGDPVAVIARGGARPELRTTGRSSSK